MTMAELNDFAMRYQREFRHSVRVGRHWRRDAYETIENTLAAERSYLGSGAPGAAIVYSYIVGTALDFLEERPLPDPYLDLQRYLDFQKELGDDIRRLEAGLERIGRRFYTPVETKIFEDVFECLSAYRRLAAVHCSRPT